VAPRATRGPGAGLGRRPQPVLPLPLSILVLLLLFHSSTILRDTLEPPTAPEERRTHKVRCGRGGGALVLACSAPLAPPRGVLRAWHLSHDRRRGGGGVLDVPRSGPRGWGASLQGGVLGCRQGWCRNFLESYSRLLSVEGRAALRELSHSFFERAAA